MGRAAQKGEDDWRLGDCHRVRDRGRHRKRRESEAVRGLILHRDGEGGSLYLVRRLAE